MVNKHIKSLMLKYSASRAFYESMRNAYLKARWHLACIRLRRYGRGILLKVEDALKDSGIAYFIDYGTLLGFAREHAFIRHDVDIDYTVFSETATPKGVYERIAKIPGFVFSHAFEFRGQITEVNFKCHDVSIDFFFCYRRACSGKYFFPAYDVLPQSDENPDGSVWSAYGRERTPSLLIERREFLKTIVPVPANYEHLLQETYGNWRQPIVGWDRTEDHGQAPISFLSDFSHRVTLERLLEIGDLVDVSKFETL